jgi:hypothetical protein
MGDGLYRHPRDFVGNVLRLCRLTAQPDNDAGRDVRVRPETDKSPFRLRGVGGKLRAAMLCVTQAAPFSCRAMRMAVSLAQTTDGSTSR